MCFTHSCGDCTVSMHWIEWEPLSVLLGYDGQVFPGVSVVYSAIMLKKALQSTVLSTVCHCTPNITSQKTWTYSSTAVRTSDHTHVTYWFVCCTFFIYRVSQEECARLRESVPYVKLYRYNPKHLCPKLNGYGDNGQRILKLWQLLHTYWLPNTY